MSLPPPRLEWNRIHIHNQSVNRTLTTYSVTHFYYDEYGNSEHVSFHNEQPDLDNNVFNVFAYCEQTHVVCILHISNQLTRCN